MHAVKVTMRKEREAEAKMFKGRFKAPAPDVTGNSGPAEGGPSSSASPYMRVSTSEIEPAAQQPPMPKAPAGRRVEVQRGALGMVLLVLSWLWAALLRALGLRPR